MAVQGDINLWDRNDTNKNRIRIHARSDGSTSSPTLRLDPASTSTSFTPPTADSDDCNESLKHSNTQKAVYHSMKGAKRFVEENQHEQAARIAAHAGQAYLESEGKAYDAERSADYLQDNIIEDRPREDNLGEAIEKAWNKIDSGEHIGGARIAVSVGVQWVDGFTP